MAGFPAPLNRQSAVAAMVILRLPGQALEGHPLDTSMAICYAWV